MKLLRKPQIEERIGLSSRQIDRLEKDGRFPRRVQIAGNSVGWIESEVDDWIKARAANRAPVGAPSQAAA